MSGMLTLLGRTALFAHCDIAILHEVASAATLLRFSTGDLIYDLSDSSDELYVVCEGFVKISRLFSDGREAIVQLVGTGEVFGESPLDVKDSRAQQAQVLLPTCVLVIPRSTLQQLAERSPAFALRFMQFLGQRLRKTEQLSAQFNVSTAYERVALLLLHLACAYGQPHPQGTELPIKLTQDTIALVIGATRETVSNSVGSLRRNGLLFQEARRRTLIVRLDALRQLVFEDAPFANSAD